mmetsp:Transcript_6949/g.12248  ORF Transcript_6949/g.12248 Transcript_6949/m.12248 type:complete len:918 (+) Transcript_6949:338-3091(+)
MVESLPRVEANESSEETMPNKTVDKLGKSSPKTVQTPEFTDVMNNTWKLRSNRDESEPTKEDEAAARSKLLGSVATDVRFAFGSYRGGGLLGPPKSVHHMFSDRVEVVPTQSPSEGFEQSFSNSSPGPVNKLDSSLQLISDRMAEILKKMQGRCRMPGVRFLAWVLGKLWKMLFRQVNVDLAGLKRLRADLRRAASDGTCVMLLPTHRSHMDYLLMSYLCFGFNLPMPHIASGDNLNIPVIGSIFSYGGAFFLRRSFKGDNLYKKVLYGYLLKKLREGSPVEVFVEGGRTRTGMISDPKLGMILMALRLVRDRSVPDIILLPSSIDYERAVEVNSHVDQLLGSKKKKESLWRTLAKGIRLVMQKASHGKTYVNFGDGVSIRKIIEQVEAPYRRQEDELSPASFQSSSPISNESSSSDSGDEPSSSSSPFLSWLPEEKYVTSIAQAVVTAQRISSFITPAGVLAAVLLCLPQAKKQEESAAISKEWLSEHFIGLVKLIEQAGGLTLSSAELESNPEKLSKLLSESFEPLEALLEVSSKQYYSSAKSDASKDMLQKVELECLARVRLRLRYCCGQLIPILAPYAVVATAVHSEELMRPGEPVDCGALRTSMHMVADMLRNAIPGAQLTPSKLKTCVEDLVAMGLLHTPKPDSVQSTSTCTTGKKSVDLLRVLRTLVAPSIAACCACLTATSTLSSGSPRLSQEDIIKQTQRVIQSQCRGESTDWTTQVIEFSQSSLNKVHLGTPVGFPEALSHVEIKAALANLTARGIFSSSGGIGGGCSPNSSAGTSVSIASSMSVTSFASSRSLVSDGNVSERSLSEKDSAVNGSHSSTGSHRSNERNTVTLAPQYAEPDGAKLLKVISQLQLHMYRDDAPRMDLCSKEIRDCVGASRDVTAWPSMGQTIFWSAALLSVARYLHVKK